MSENRSTIIAAAAIILGFGVAAYFLPSIMIAVGERSPVAAGVIAVLFVAAFFAVFWLRSRWQRGRRN